MVFSISTRLVTELAAACGFELAGVARAGPVADYARFQQWSGAGMAGGMSYLAGHRAELRRDPRLLMPEARSVICVGKIYNTAQPYSVDFHEPGRGWISRYGWGEDYHQVMRQGLRQLAQRLQALTPSPFACRIAVDTAPLLERSLGAVAGLGWIGKNTCLINQEKGSWFFLGELLTTLDIEAGERTPDRCGSCTRCLDACPTHALVAPGVLDARRCISYLTIEHAGPVPEELQPAMGRHIFGCDICQDVCPWNRRAPVSTDQRFQPRHFAPDVGELTKLDEAGFLRRFRRSPLLRARYPGFARNLRIARENLKRER